MLAKRITLDEFADSVLSDMEIKLIDKAFSEIWVDGLPLLEEEDLPLELSVITREDLVPEEFQEEPSSIQRILNWIEESALAKNFLWVLESSNDVVPDSKCALFHALLMIEKEIDHPDHLLACKDSVQIFEKAMKINHEEFLAHEETQMENPLVKKIDGREFYEKNIYAFFYFIGKIVNSSGVVNLYTLSRAFIEKVVEKERKEMDEGSMFQKRKKLKERRA